MKAWRYNTAKDQGLPLTDRLRRVPREPDMLVYGVRLVAAIFLRGWLRAYHRLTVSGREHLPAQGSVVLIANHASHLDALCLLAAIPLKRVQRAFPVAASDYFFASLPSTVAAAIAINALPFDRIAHQGDSLRACRELLLTNPGTILIFFPEGTRSASGAIGEFKSGIGALVAGCDVPVVPCYLDGASRAWPKGRWFPRPRRLRLRIGEPRSFAQAAPGKESGLRIAEELRQAVIDLQGFTGLAGVGDVHDR